MRGYPIVRNLPNVDFTGQAAFWLDGSILHGPSSKKTREDLIPK
jgi:hypothetical protein